MPRRSRALSWFAARSWKTIPTTIGAGVTITGCIIPPCPPPPALIIDVTALPQAPAGSDAGRIARGLPPIGNDTGDRIPTELEKKRDETSPAESEEPAGVQ